MLPAIFILVLNFLMADRFYKVVQKRRTLRARLFMQVAFTHILKLRKEEVYVGVKQTESAR